MKKLIFFISLTIIISFSLNILTADEGMYTPDTIKKLNLEKKGLKIPVEDIFNPPNPGLYEAVIKLGATAEFVSPDGLILTNHHVAFGSVARISTPEKDYITDGFLAKSKDEEIKAIGYEGRILKLYKDVTKEMTRGIKEDVSEEFREKILEENRKKIINKAEKEYPELEEFRIRGFYDGNKYYLSGYFVIRDIRIVYVPPKSIGNYGGDIDNWEWPRHTGDFSFLRAYVSKDGKGVEYSEDNVPYHPRTWFEIETNGVNAGDFVFIMGFPGSTYRYKSSNFFEERFETYFPFYKDFFGKRIEFLENESKKDKSIELRYASLVKGLSNAWKKYKGSLEFYKRLNIIENKKKEEQEFVEFINKDEKLKKEYGNLLDELDVLYLQKRALSPLDYAIRSYRFSRIIYIANTIYNYSLQKEKPDDERPKSFRDKNIKNLITRTMMNISNLYLPHEKFELTDAFLRTVNLPENLRIDRIEKLLAKMDDDLTREEKAVKLIEKAFKTSKLLDSKNIDKLFEMSTNEFINSDDIFLRISYALIKAKEKFEAIDKDLSDKEDILQRKYTKGMMLLKKSKGEVIYPDANSTFRFNYGYVKGLKARDAVNYKPFTTLSGVMEKYTGEEPFDLPEKMFDIYKNKNFARWKSDELNDVPVCMLDNLDSTGGNSGSPVLNAYGKLVGCHFDSNYEGLTGDFDYIPEYKRSIEVDIRYILMITEKFGAGYLFEEMGIK